MSTVIEPASAADVFVDVSVDDPRAQPLLDELADEYATRYAGLIDPDAIRHEMLRYPADRFVPPAGAFILLPRDGLAIAGGAFMPHPDADTTEFKRIWVSRTHRRQGLSRRVLAELEARAVAQGYARVYLGTGPRQPEAIALYRTSGYRLLSAHDFGEEAEPGYRFDKTLVEAARAG